MYQLIVRISIQISMGWLICYFILKFEVFFFLFLSMAMVLIWHNFINIHGGFINCSAVLNDIIDDHQMPYPLYNTIMKTTTTTIITTDSSIKVSHVSISKVSSFIHVTINLIFLLLLSSVHPPSPSPLPSPDWLLTF